MLLRTVPSLFVGLLLAGACSAHLPICENDFTCSTAHWIPQIRPGARVSAQAIFIDSGMSIRSDGKGAYVNGVDDTFVSVIGAASVETRNQRINPLPRPKRALIFDLDHPVAGTAAQPMGVVVDSGAEMHVMWLFANCQLQNYADIPLGKTVHAGSASLTIHQAGKTYWLLAGVVQNTDCTVPNKSRVRNEGSTDVLITHEADSVWMIEAPEGTIGRLWDVTHTDVNAVDKGLYRFTLKVRLSPKRQ